MAQSDYPNYYNDRPQRTRERAQEWREGRNGEYQAQGWEPDYERDSALGEYYPTDNYMRKDRDFSDQDYRAPRSLQENRETGYNDRYSGSYDRPPTRDRDSNRYANQFDQPSHGGGQGTRSRRYETAQRDHFTGVSYGEARTGYDRQSSSAIRGQEEGAHRGKGPKGYRRSDERIHEQICELLSDDHAIDASDITVSVKDGTVTLEGTVPARRMKHQTEDIVAGCTGVMDVHNRIKVGSVTG